MTSGLIYFIGLDHTSDLRCCVFHTVPVCQSTVLPATSLTLYNSDKTSLNYARLASCHPTRCVVLNIYPSSVSWVYLSPANTTTWSHWHSMPVCCVPTAYRIKRIDFPLTGFLVWEFPTVYISQKLPVAKYLGERSLMFSTNRIY